MTLFQDTGGDPRACAERLADVLAWYGAVGDAAAGNPAGFARRKAAVAVSIARVAQLDSAECDALAFAGLMHATGAIGNLAYAKGERLPERLARMESWDVPAAGARACESLAALPAATADMVRWQSECWDGTGYPDQLRWHSIPQPSQVLSVADAFIRNPDPDEALGAIGLQSGRAQAPETTRAFTTWYHTTGGEADELVVPIDALRAAEDDASIAIDAFADRIDEHNGVPGRWRRIAHLCEATAAILDIDAPSRQALMLATRLFGTGELQSSEVEDSQFDALARLGIDHRATHAKAAAAFADGNATLQVAVPVLRARGEWFDGTGKPNGHRNDMIPIAAGILAAAIAYDTLAHGPRSGVVEHRGSPAERLDTASGTQFDPKVTRAMLEAVRTHA